MISGTVSNLANWSVPKYRLGRFPSRQSGGVGVLKDRSENKTGYMTGTLAFKLTTRVASSLFYSLESV